MADAKITALGEMTVHEQADELAIVNDTGGTPATQKITRKNLFTPQWFFCEKTSQQAMTTSLSDVTGFATAEQEDAAFSFNVSTGILTINTTGLYMIGYKVMFNLQTGTRVHGFAEMQINTGAGYNAMGGMAIAGYGRTVDEATSGSGQRIIALTAGDLIKIQAIEVGGSLEVNDPTYGGTNIWAYLMA